MRYLTVALTIDTSLLLVVFKGTASFVQLLFGARFESWRWAFPPEAWRCGEEILISCPINFKCLNPNVLVCPFSLIFPPVFLNAVTSGTLSLCMQHQLHTCQHRAVERLYEAGRRIKLKTNLKHQATGKMRQIMTSLSFGEIFLCLKDEWYL